MSAVTDFFHSLGPAPAPQQLGPLSQFLGPSSFTSSGLPNVNFGPPAASTAANENLFASSSPLFDIGGPQASEATIGSPANFSIASLFTPSVDSNTGQTAQPVDQATIDASAANLNASEATNVAQPTDSSSISASQVNPGMIGGIPFLGPILGLGNVIGNLATGSGKTTASADQAPITGNSFFQNVFNITGSFFTRAGLVLLAIVIIGIGLWAMLSKTKIGVTIKEGARTAATTAAAAA